MIFVVLGIIMGIAVALGPLQVLAAPVDWVINALMTYTNVLIQNLANAFSENPSTHRMGLALGAVLSVFAPGIVTMALVWASKAAKNSRKAIGALGVILAFAGFWFLPFLTALALFIIALVLAAMLGLLEGFTITMPLIGVATVIAVRYGVLMWTKQSEVVHQSAVDVANLVGGELKLWMIILTIAGVMPFVYAAAFALRDDPSGKK